MIHIKKIVTIFIFLLSLGKIYAQNDTISVMSYNIWNGFDWDKAKDRKAKLINWVKSKDPNILALQELNGYTQEKLEEDAKKWGHSYALLLKENGYSVGLTSKTPIKLREKVRDEMWHGLLHCETYGIDFFVVHLSPSDQRFRNKEAGIIKDRISKIKNENYMVLGDFNAHSPFDGDYLKTNNKLLKKYLESDNKPGNKFKNTLNNNFDFNVISTFLSIPSIDVGQMYIETKSRYSFPTPALIGENLDLKQVNNFKERIDYIFVSPKLVKSCINSIIYNSEATFYLSDHFPVEAKFIFPKK